MKRNVLTILVGAILLLIFVVLLFTFQVRSTEVVVVTTFNNPSTPIDAPGLYWKWPLPIQKVYRFDKRIQNFEEDPLEETYTLDKQPLLVKVYAGWTIRNATNFFSRFPSGTIAEARPALEGLIRTHKNAVVGRHPFSHFISTDKNELKFIDIEKEIWQDVRGDALRTYGIDIQFVGIDRLALPESVTQKVFDRMKSERERAVQEMKASGEAEASTIRSAADRDRRDMLANAEAKATEIRGEAEAEAKKSYEIFQRNPDLAVFLQRLNALKEILKERATLILDEQTPPFNLLHNVPSPTGAPQQVVADRDHKKLPSQP